jgi:ferric-dicitrate binding protein FerR (iron transport regulator)
MIEGETRYARLAARLLNEQQAEDPQVPADVRRDAVVAALALAIAAKARRRRIVALSAGTLALAAGVAMVVKLTGGSDLTSAKPVGAARVELVVEHAIGSGNQLVRAGATQPLPDLGVLAVGDSVHSGQDGMATLGYANGTRITLSSSARLRVDDLGTTRRFSLSSGQLQAHVVKLGQGDRFIVSTPDSEVEVHGTVFTVAVDNSPSRCRDSASSSTVSVSEGAVWVRSGDKQVVLQPGESWATPCHEPRNTAAEVVGPGPVAMPNQTGTSVRAPAHKVAAARVTSTAAPTPVQLEFPVVPSLEPPHSLAPAPSVSRLAEQNDLFSAAMTAERRGQHDLALRTLDELVTRYPSGPLSESARAERQRILSAK